MRLQLFLGPQWLLRVQEECGVGGGPRRRETAELRFGGLRALRDINGE